MRPFTSTLMLSGMRLSSSVSLNSDFHQQLGVDRAGARLDHDADVLGRFVAHVGQQRQLLLVEQLGELLDQPALLHQPGNFGDDD